MIKLFQLMDAMPLSFFIDIQNISTTKNEEQRRRSSKKNSCDIHFEKNTKYTTPNGNLCRYREDIVNVDVEKLQECSKIVVVGSDTD